MRWHILAVILAGFVGMGAGCKAEQERYPVRPGGGVPPGGGGGDGYPDAGPYKDAYYGGADGGALLRGRVCRVLDLRYPTQCDPLEDMSGIEVAVRGGSTTTTSVTGSFYIDVAGATEVVLDVGRGSSYFVPSVIPLDLSADPMGSVPIPLVDADAWQDLLVALDTQLPTGTGSVTVYVRDQDYPLAGAEVTNVSAAAGIYYDNGGAQSWNLGGLTGSAGTALVLGVNEPAAELTVSESTGTRYQNVGNIPVLADAITFITADLYYQ